MSVRFKWPPDLAAFRFGSTLIWALRGGGIPATVTGISPLSLVNAIAKPITKLLQHGKVAVSGMDVVCNNGTLKFGAIGNNLAEMSEKNIVVGKYISATGSVNADANNFFYQSYIPVTPNTAYTLSVSQTCYFISISEYQADKTFIVRNAGSTNIRNLTITTGADTYFIRFGSNMNRTTLSLEDVLAVNWMLNKGDAGLPYEPFIGGIYADGTPEEIVVQGANLLDWSKVSFAGGTHYGMTFIRGTREGEIVISGTLTVSGGAVAPISYADYSLSGKGYKFLTEHISGDSVIDLPRTYGFRTESEKAIAVYLVGTEEQSYTETIRVSVYAETPTDWTPYHHETAHAENLFAVGDIEDTQDIISGTVTHRTEAVVSDGTTPSGRYVGTVGEGNIIVKVREDGYTGDIASFETEEETPLNGLIVSLSPQQDLHGYDAPWPPGGGANICDPLLKFTAGTYYGVTLSTTDGYNFTLSGTGTESGNVQCPTIPTADCVVYPAGTYTSTGAIFSTYKPDGSWYTNRQVGTWTADSDFIIRSAYIQIVEGTTPSSAPRFLSLTKGSTALTSWSPYSNICPISGWTGVDVNRTGKNVLNIVESEMVSTGWNRWFPMRFKAGTYTMSCQNKLIVGGVNKSARIQLTDSTKTGIRGISGGYTFGGDNMSFSFSITEEEANIIEGILFEPVVSGVTFEEINAMQNMIELGSTATAYEEYRGNSYSVAFGKTLYHADIDVISGEGTGLTEKVVYNGTVGGSSDFASIEIGQYTDQNFTMFTLTLRNSTRYSYDGVKIGQYAMCNILPWEYANQDGTAHWYKSARVGVFIPASIATTVEEFNAFAANQPLEFVLALAYETQETITPTPITALKGQNNIWSNAGAVTAYVPTGDLIERVTPQKLSTAEGDNTITVTAEVEDIVFDVIYSENNPDG